MKFTVQSFFLAFVLLATLAGCNTIAGMGEDIEATGEAVEDAADGDE
ncbi:MAG: entericidin A/B family lipoprotein [Oleiphilaceae bacterium]|nr:entericidin A/B family lipoprotein [Oleiphilaceae bacterium]